MQQFDGVLHDVVIFCEVVHVKRHMSVVAQVKKAHNWVWILHITVHLSSIEGMPGRHVMLALHNIEHMHW